MSPLPLLIVWSLMVTFCPTEGQNLSPRDKCVTNAHFSETEKKCKCDQGYKGSARLCCGREDQGVCHLISDPILNTAHDVISEISFPCTTSIAVIEKSYNGVNCTVKVNIAGPYKKQVHLFFFLNN
ncbi:hypothetical protein Btru_042069 [Bulinus truncatus]|nr:hypothetical protein Btru_042069 [Bulinus truncatus]